MDEGTDTGHDHRILHEAGREALFQSADIGEDNDGGDVRDEHRKDVLESEEDGLPQRDASVKLIKSVGTFHIVGFCDQCLNVIVPVATSIPGLPEIFDPLGLQKLCLQEGR